MTSINMYRFQWQQTVERMRGLFVFITIVQLLFTLLLTQYATYNMIQYQMASTAAILGVTLLTIIFGAFKLGAVENADVFRLPPSIKWRTDVVMLILLCLYGSVTSLLVGYIKFLSIKDTEVLYVDRTLINELYFYTNILVSFSMMLVVAIGIYTFRLCMTYSVVRAVVYAAAIIVVSYIAFDKVIQTIPSTTQWLGLTAMLLFMEWLFLHWQYKGGRR